jgi:hypothetical protein
MADRTVHYEAAFEGFLRERRIPYVAVDEAKKALFANAKLKSFDFVVYPQNKQRLLIDVKGRSLRNRAKRSGFETWATEADVKDLLQWEQVFGEGFSAVFAFVYWVDPPLFAPDPGGGGAEEGRTSNVQRSTSNIQMKAGGTATATSPSSILQPPSSLSSLPTACCLPLTDPGVFQFRDRWYLLMGIDLAEYRDHMRRRSAKWETVCLPAEDFRSLARPIESWL